MVLLHEMAEYHSRFQGFQAEDTEQPLLWPAANRSSEPAYMSLDEDYGFVDGDMAIESMHSHIQQTTDQELHSYLSAPLSPASMSILQFWEVSKRNISLNSFMLMDIYYLTSS